MHCSLHLRHEHLIAVILFRSMSFVAHCIHLVTVISLNILWTMIACSHKESNAIIYHARQRKKFSMTFPIMHGSMRRVRQKFSETEMNQHIGKTLATQGSHIHQTNISFTYTSNHHKLH